VKITIQCDGGVGPTNPGVAYGSYAISGDVQATASRVPFGDGLTNNDSEYLALICGLRHARELCDVTYTELTILSDSMLVVQQVRQRWKCPVARLRVLRDETLRLLTDWRAWRIDWIPRARNVEVLGH
jgi:ribonuclease HI